MRRIRTALGILLFLCAGAGPAAAAAGLDWDAPRRGAVSELLVLNRLETTVTNTGDLPDVFHVAMVRQLPLGWAGTLCAGVVCYPPHILEIDLPLNPGASINLDVDLTAIGAAGAGFCEVTVSSANDPSQTRTLTFALISSELDVLVAAADGGDGSAAFFAAAVTAAGRSAGLWYPAAVDLPAAADLAAFEAVVWAGGTASGVLTESARSALAFYVSQGGDLLVSGQDLAADYCDPGSPLFSAGAAAWFQGVLGTQFLADDAGLATVAGVAGDLIGDELAFALGGGDGADHLQTPDRLTPAGGGTACFEYAPGVVAGIRFLFGAGRTCHLGFGFEDIAAGADRDAVMLAILNWFAGLSTGVEGAGTPPLLAAAAAVPNPFNPRTELRLTVGGSAPAEVAIVIHDVRGRAVRRLFAGTVEPGGAVFAWDGRDDRGRGLGSGLYLARIRVRDEVRTLKMTLVE